ncbi:MAG: 3-deoxy-manno-octulosonate cytidylyltransferase [Planctomycetes bacterium]|nr:3-deoxy-manno-octulosonate cytidylyltransferase [Planctomycetota bacterium]
MSPRQGSGAPRAIAIVPVRVDSQRLPGKALLAETGRPLFLHTVERALQARCFAATYVATDSDAVDAAARKAGVPVVRTSPACRTGSERCAEAARELDAALVVDIQGDWPEVDPGDLEALVHCLAQAGPPTATLAVPLSDPARIEDPNVVKVVRARNGDALYFSRCAIPYARSGSVRYARLRHIGVYGFQREVLLGIPALPSSGLDESEGLEQLRFLENGISMRVLDAKGDPWGIETRPDYDAFLRRQAARGGAGGAVRGGGIGEGRS